MTQLPPKLHTAVNSGRSNQLIEATAMSEALEPWSHPWHVLQRTLAKAFGADAAGYPEPADRPATAALPAGDARFPAADAPSWLVRARNAAASPAALTIPR